MRVVEFITSVPKFADLLRTEQVTILGWYLHTYNEMERFGTRDVRRCYAELHLKEPNVADVLASLAAKKPPVLLRSGDRYRLEMRVRAQFDARYLNRPVAIPIEKTLEELPGKVNNDAERKYLAEAIKCYRVEAYRAAIVLSWNLAYDHLVNWILADPARLAAFNGRLPNKEPFSAGLRISDRVHFEELKESETISICAKLNLISGNQKQILEEKLRRRNQYAHPNTLEVSLYRVGDHICDLVNNVVLQLN